MCDRLLRCLGWVLVSALLLHLGTAHGSAASPSLHAPALAGGTTVRISVAADGTQTVGGSVGPAISADGRFVAFVSSAAHLVALDTNNDLDAFVVDRLTRQVTRVSVASNGAQAVGSTYYVTIATDGRVAAFISWAGLVPVDTNRAQDVFAYDLPTGTTTRVSVASDGTQANAGSGLSGLALSASGRFVAFDSDASNLVPDDTNAHSDIFVRDRLAGQTTRVSVASNGAQSGNRSWGAAISADGRYVAFASESNVLVAGDTNSCGLATNGACPDVFVHDRVTRETTRVSVASDGTQGNDRSGDRGIAISADGRYVAFESAASNLVGGDTNNALDVFVHDRQTGQTSRVSVASDGTQGNDSSLAAGISADGQSVAFLSHASNLVAGDTNECSFLDYNYRNGHCPDVFVHNRVSGETIRASVSSDGTQANDMSSIGSPALALSANGLQVAFDSSADNLVAGDTNLSSDVFVHTIPAATIASNYPNALPGSWLAIAGEHFPPNTSIALAINGHSLGSVGSDSAGAWAVLLSTDQADVGYYSVTARANGVDAATTFWLDSAAPLRAKVGNGPVFAVPAGAAFSNVKYLPFMDAH